MPSIEKEIFTDRKVNMILLLQSAIANGVTVKEREELGQALNIVNEYTFENKLRLKGSLSHTIIDCLSLEYGLAEQLLAFDEAIK